MNFDSCQKSDSVWRDQLSWGQLPPGLISKHKLQINAVKNFGGAIHGFDSCVQTSRRTAAQLVFLQLRLLIANTSVKKMAFRKWRCESDVGAILRNYQARPAVQTLYLIPP